MNLLTLAAIEGGAFVATLGLGVAVRLLMDWANIGGPYGPRPRRRLTKFEREIIRARMDADSELEYDRIARALGFRDQSGYPPQADIEAERAEIHRRFADGEVSEDQWRSELTEFHRTRGSGRKGNGGLAG